MGVSYLVNLLVFPLLSYPFRRSISNHPRVWKWLILYWFSDASEDNYIDDWYGVYEIYNNYYDKFHTLNWFQKYLLSLKWAVLRNPNWNLQILFKPKDGDRYRINKIAHEGEAGIFQWRSKEIFGKQYVTWFTDGTKYFRYSYTKRFDFLGKDYINVQIGASNNRFILKLRIFFL